MKPATRWNEIPSGPAEHGWTVLGELAKHELQLRTLSENARTPPPERQPALEGTSFSISPIRSAEEYRKDLRRHDYLARWHGGPFLLAFFFAQPDSDSISILDNRGSYFNQRSGDTWNLFLPGYYKSEGAHEDENPVIGGRFLKRWRYDASVFNELRKYVEYHSNGRWVYSGGADLVLVNAYMPEAVHLQSIGNRPSTGRSDEKVGTSRQICPR